MLFQLENLKRVLNSLFAKRDWAVFSVVIFCRHGERSPLDLVKEILRLKLWQGPFSKLWLLSE